MPLSESDRAIFADAYRYYEKYSQRELNTAVFIEAADEWAQLVEKNKNSPLAKSLLQAIYEHFGDKYEEARRILEDGKQ